MIFAEHLEYENDLVDALVSAACLLGYSYKHKNSYGYVRDGISNAIKYNEIRIKKLNIGDGYVDMIVLTVSCKTGKLLVGYHTLLEKNFTYGVKEHLNSYDMSIGEVMNRVMKWL